MTQSAYSSGYFITGTDTGVGKTVVACALVRKLVSEGIATGVMKPVSAGCRWTGSEWKNDDAEALMAASNVAADYATVNPFAFEPAIAPHIAAAESGVDIAIEPIVECYRSIAAASETVIVEGAGGWLVPVNDTVTLADVAVGLELPVILVVGMRLGCLNHALLSAGRIASDGAKLAGWVANFIDPDFEKAEENLAALVQRIGAPLLGTVPHGSDVGQTRAEEYIDLEGLRRDVS